MRHKDRHRTTEMHAFKLSLIVVFSSIAMVDAIPVGNRAPTDAMIVRRQDDPGAVVKYVPYYSGARRCSNLVKKKLPQAKP